MTICTSVEVPHHDALFLHPFCHWLPLQLLLPRIEVILQQNPPHVRRLDRLRENSEDPSRPEAAGALGHAGVGGVAVERDHPEAAGDLLPRGRAACGSRLFFARKGERVFEGVRLRRGRIGGGVIAPQPSTIGVGEGLAVLRVFIPKNDLVRTASVLSIVVDLRQAVVPDTDGWEEGRMVRVTDKSGRNFHRAGKSCRDGNLWLSWCLLGEFLRAL